MEKYVPLVTKQCVRKILLDEIVYIMKKSRKIEIVTEQERYEFYERMDAVVPLLDRRFYPCLQNCMINLDKVSRMEQQVIYLVNGDSIPMGRDNFVRTRQQYVAYLKKLL